MVDAKNVEQLLHLLGCSRDHSGSLRIIERLIERLIAVAREV
jgi:hypothetical protein